MNIICVRKKQTVELNFQITKSRNSFPSQRYIHKKSISFPWRDTYVPKTVWHIPQVAMDLLFGSVQIQNLKRLVGENSEEQNKISQIIFSQSYSKTYQLGGLGKTCQNQVFCDYPKSSKHLFSKIRQQCFFSLQFWSFSSQISKLGIFAPKTSSSRVFSTHL